MKEFLIGAICLFVSFSVYAEIDVTPDSLAEVSLSLEDVASQQLTITNNGSSIVTYSITINNASQTPAASADDSSSVQAEPAAGIQGDRSEEREFRRAGYTPGKLLVKFKDTVSQANVRTAHAAAGAQIIKVYEEIGVHKVNIPNNASAAEIINCYLQSGLVEYAEPDYIVKALATPNDPSYSSLWGLHNTGQTGGTSDADIDAPEAWSVITGSSAVVIAVIDTGVDYNHPDLAANIWTGSNGGYGYDFFNGDSDPMDDNNHGTHCAGTIAGVGNNGTGVAGVNWQAKIMACKFLSADGYGSVSDAVDAIIYAVNNGAHILSNSWGGSDYSQALKDAIEYANTNNVLFVAAAGNSGTDNDYDPQYPASYDCDNIISVAATDHSDDLAYFSCYGTTSVDIGAPGVDIYSTIPGSSYDTYSGTSMATPHVAGVAGLVLAQNPDYDDDQIKESIFNGAEQISALSGKCVTGGRLNAYRSLNASNDTIAPATINPLAVAGVGYQSIILAWRATGDDGNSGTGTSYDIRYSTSEITAANFAEAAQVDGPGPAAAGTMATYAVTGLTASTRYYFALKLQDEAGNASAMSNTVSATTTSGTLIFSDNMESGGSNWTASSGSLWHLSRHRYSSFAQSWYYGTEAIWSYNTGLSKNSGSLVSKEIDLGSVTDCSFSFKYWREVEYYSSKNYDLTSVKVSYDNTTETIWYKSSDNASEKQWTDSGTISLQDYAGKTIQLQFEFDTVDYYYNGYEGWYLDDIQVYGTTAGTDWLSFSPNTETLAAGESAEVTIYYNGNVAPGTYTCTLDINTDDSSQSAISLPVSMNVAGMASSIWYLPEGCTDGFDEYVLIMNPYNFDAAVKVTFLLPDGSTQEQQVTVGAARRYTIYVNDVISSSSVSTIVQSLNGIPVIAERAMYWNVGSIEWEGGHCTIGLTSLSGEWYFAEGCTDNFDEWVLIVNPNSLATSGTATFMFPDGTISAHDFTVGANSRYSIHVNDHVSADSVSVKIETDLPTAAERAMYWNSYGVSWIDGHVAPGVAAPAKEWYLAEGSTNGFDEYVLIMNPNAEPALVEVTFMLESGTNYSQSVIVNPTSRYTVYVNSHIWRRSVSTRVVADQNVVAERAMYWDVSGWPWRGGHLSPGTTSAGTVWTLAEGSTSGTFDEWVLIMNPGSETADVIVTFMTPAGENISENISIAPHSRHTVYVNDYVADDSVSTKILSLNNVPVIAERAMYWDSSSGRNWAGGHVSVGTQ